MDAEVALPELNDLSRKVIGCGFTVLNALGPGFLEKVYQNALARELCDAGLAIARQRDVKVFYKGDVVGEYFVDLLVENRLLVELKAVRVVEESHRLQCVNYLKASGLNLCLLLNFARPRLEIKRIVWGL